MRWIACGSGRPVLLIVSSLVFFACSEPSAETPSESPEGVARLVLEDFAAQSGVDFVPESRTAEPYSMPEIMSGGVCAFDADEDEDIDLLFVNGTGDHPLFLFDKDRYTRGPSLPNAGGYGIGCAVADLDADGFLDVVVTRFGKDQLFYGEQGARFVQESLPLTPGFSVSATALYADGDEILDVFVARYVEYDASQECSGIAGAAEFCGPAAFPPTKDVLVLGRAGREHVIAGAESGLGTAARPGLGVMAVDFDRDGRQDVFVANDGEANQLWRNVGGGRFEDTGVVAGVATNLLGQPEASMGIAWGDMTGDGEQDLLLTHLDRETHTLYRGNGEGGFVDATATTGLAAETLPLTGFGVELGDLDLDGIDDLCIAHGRVRLSSQRRRAESAGGAGTSGALRPYAEPDRCYLGLASGGFTVEESFELGTEPAVSRGLLLSDLDGDGDLDVVVTRLRQNPGVWINSSPRRGSWLVVDARELAPSGLPVAALGATVRARSAGGAVWQRTALHTRSYASSADAAVHFGLGSVSEVEVDVVWRDGTTESFGSVSTGQTVQLIRGQGSSV